MTAGRIDGKSERAVLTEEYSQLSSLKNWIKILENVTRQICEGEYLN